MNRPCFSDRALGFRQPQIDMRGQAVHQRGEQLTDALGLEQIWAIRAKQRRQ